MEQREERDHVLMLQEGLLGNSNIAMEYNDDYDDQVACSCGCFCYCCCCCHPAYGLNCPLIHMEYNDDYDDQVRRSIFSHLYMLCCNSSDEYNAL